MGLAVQIVQEFMTHSTFKPPIDVQIKTDLHYVISQVPGGTEVTSRVTNVLSCSRVRVMIFCVWDVNNVVMNCVNSCSQLLLSVNSSLFATLTDKKRLATAETAKY